MQQHNQQEQILITNVSGAILSFRVQEFPSRSTSEQVTIIHQIQQIFTGLSTLPVQGRKLNWRLIDYHDGSFIFFLRDSPRGLPPPTQLIVCLALAIALKLYEKKWQYTLTIALHWGDDVQIVGSKGSLQAINGQTLSVTHHIISFVASSPILIAEQAFENIKISLFRNKFFDDSCEHFVHTLKQAVGNNVSFPFPLIEPSNILEKSDHYSLQPIMLLDHQQRKTQWYTFVIEDEKRVSKVGNRSLPMEQVPMGIYNPEQHLAQRTNAIDSDLVEQLIWSDEIVLIDITHHFLPNALEQALKERGTFWRKIQVVYPNRNNMQRLIDEGQIPSERLSEWKGSRKQVQVFLGACIPQRSGYWECLECNQDLSFIGARYMHNGQAYIRFAPLLLGSDPRNTVQLTIVSNVALFDQISRVIDTLVLPDAKIRYAAPLTEWELLGQYDHDVFRYRGIINRRDIVDFPKGLAFPNVLIVLYVQTLEGTCVALQERKIYNAIDDFGIYSNISGRLCTDDVGNRFWVDPATSTVVATNAFNEISKLSEGEVLDEIVWQRAAVRELQEELGLDIDIDRLEKRSSYYLERENAYLFFLIFSLKLRQDPTVDEWETIQQRRPHAALEQFRMRELEQLHRDKKLNRLLQTHFTDLFLPLFEQMQIAP